MIEFTQDFQERMKRKLARYSQADTLGNVTGSVSVSTRKGSNQLSETTISGSDFKWKSEEAGPSPLAYFLSGMTMCQSVHFAEYGGSAGLKIEDLTVDAIGTFTVSRPRSFTGIDYTVRITTGEDRNGILEMVKSAVNDCFVTNTLKKACPVRGKISINNEEPTEIPE